MGEEQLVEVRAWMLLVVIIVNQFAMADFWDFVHPNSELWMFPVIGNFILATFDNVEIVANGFNRLAGSEKPLERMNVVFESCLAVGANVSHGALDQMDVGLRRQLVAQADEDHRGCPALSGEDQFFAEVLQVLQAPLAGFERIRFAHRRMASFNNNGHAATQGLQKKRSVDVWGFPQWKQNRVAIGDALGQAGHIQGSPDSFTAAVVTDVISWFKNAEAMAKKIVVFQEKSKIFIGSDHFFKGRLIAPAFLNGFSMD